MANAYIERSLHCLCEHTFYLVNFKRKTLPGENKRKICQNNKGSLQPIRLNIQTELFALLANFTKYKVHVQLAI